MQFYSIKFYNLKRLSSPQRKIRRSSPTSIRILKFLPHPLPPPPPLPKLIESSAKVDRLKLFVLGKTMRLSRESYQRDGWLIAKLCSRLLLREANAIGFCSRVYRSSPPPLPPSIFLIKTYPPSHSTSPHFTYFSSPLPSLFPLPLELNRIMIT